METLLTTISLMLQIAACVLAADFISGLFHWLEDSYGNPNWPIVGKWITQANDLHHREPRAFLEKNWFQSADVGLLAGALVLGIAAIFGWLTWQLVLILALLVNANEFHKWSHRTRKENPAIVLRLQRWGLLQTPRHHGRHHQGRKDSHYCIVTAYLNPWLDRSGFWRRLEKVAFAAFRVKKRADPTISRFQPSASGSVSARPSPLSPIPSTPLASCADKR